MKLNNNIEIREYTNSDESAFKQFYTTLESKKRRTRVLHALQHRSSLKRTWQAGIIGILGIHFQLHQQPQNNIPVILVELILWSAGVGYCWYKYLCQEYNAKLKQRSQEIANGLNQIIKKERCNAWVLLENGSIVGTVALKYEKGKKKEKEEQEEEEGEGKIGYLTGQETKTRLDLVQHAIRFGKTNKMKVISTKWSNEQDLKWSEQAEKL